MSTRPQVVVSLNSASRDLSSYPQSEDCVIPLGSTHTQIDYIRLANFQIPLKQQTIETGLNDEVHVVEEGETRICTLREGMYTAAMIGSELVNALNRGAIVPPTGYPDDSFFRPACQFGIRLPNGVWKSLVLYGSSSTSEFLAQAITDAMNQLVAGTPYSCTFSTLTQRFTFTSTPSYEHFSVSFDENKFPNASIGGVALPMRCSVAADRLGFEPNSTLEGASISSPFKVPVEAPPYLYSVWITGNNFTIQADRYGSFSDGSDVTVDAVGNTLTFQNPGNTTIDNGEGVVVPAQTPFFRSEVVRGMRTDGTYVETPCAPATAYNVTPRPIDATPEESFELATPASFTISPTKLSQSRLGFTSDLMPAPASSLTAPGGHNVSDVPYVFIVVDDHRGYTNHEAVYNGINTGRNVIMKLQFPLHPTDSPSQIGILQFNACAATLNSLRIQILNPDFTPYRLHGANYGFTATLVGKAVPQEANLLFCA